MNVYNKILNLHKIASTAQEQDVIFDSFIKVANIIEKDEFDKQRLNNAVKNNFNDMFNTILQQRLEIFKLNNIINNIILGNASTSQPKSTTEEGIALMESPNFAGRKIVKTNPSQSVTLLNDNFAKSQQALVNELGVTLNSTENIV